jgi:ppGpp synthetase/RelA/SpoT-type nucleotidyltranferase
MTDAETLIRTVKERFRHELWDEDDYIHDSKKDSYRCHHLKYAYTGRGNSVIHNGRRIEVQIRTNLQHSWATAVEAIGMSRGEELKSGQGSPEWRRLFALMSAEFAEAEGCDSAKGMPGQLKRMRELRGLNSYLGAVQVLVT